MPTVKLHDERDPIEVGGELFARMMSGEDVEIRTDREALGHAFADACGAFPAKLADLSDIVLQALSFQDDVVSGRRAIEARDEMAHAFDVLYTLMGVIWDTTPGIRRAEAQQDARRMCG